MNMVYLLINLYSLSSFTQALRLDNNRLTDINGLLTTQNHLQWLNVSYNSIQWFDYAFVPKSVLWLNMRNNAIEELGNYYEMRTGFHLLHLDVGQNKLIRLDKQSLQNTLREVSYENLYAIQSIYFISFYCLFKETKYSVP